MSCRATYGRIGEFSGGHLVDRLAATCEIEPVVILLVPHPATLAASVIATVAEAMCLKVALIERQVICAGSPILRAADAAGLTPTRSNIPLTLTDG